MQSSWINVVLNSASTTSMGIIVSASYPARPSGLARYVLAIIFLGAVVRAVFYCPIISSVELAVWGALPIRHLAGQGM